MWNIMRLFLLPILGAALSGCAHSLRVEPVTPAEVDALDAALAQHGDNADELTRIGIRYYEAGRYTRATDVLAAALTIRPDGFPGLVYRGLAWEALSQFDSALVAYQATEHLRLTRGERREVEARLTLLGRARLGAEMRRAIARESTISQVPPRPNTLAILPWLYVGTDPELQALGRGIAHLLVSDLSKISRITLLERERVQALLDELGLITEGRIDPATAARSGRLLGAARVLQGSIRETGPNGGLALEAQVVNTITARIDATGEVTDRLQQLFAMEKIIVFQLLDELGIQPTPAERAALSERPTADLQAFLAFSRGLEAQDRGDPKAAGVFFGNAVDRDPGFRTARALAVVAETRAHAESSSDRLAILANPWAPGIHAPGRRETLQRAVHFIVPSSGGAIDQSALTRPPVTKPRVPEALGQDNPSRITVVGEIIIVIPRP